ncbi:alpha/beta fold hydrolase [Celerinatantimonas yamalensis]
MQISDYYLDVPLDWQHPEFSAPIQVFIREVVDANRANESLPLLLFLQGGPGGKSPRPQLGSPCWLAQALKTHRVILLDQRGTGRSSRIDANLMRQMSAEQGCAYLLEFRADSIVADCEWLRTTRFAGQKFETLGQSYGGFITLTYLSQAPQGLAACYVTGGLAGISASIDEIYTQTYQSVADKTQQYYQRYPDDMVQMARIADRLQAEPVYLPDGDTLTIERFQSLGILFGMGSGFEQLHWLVEEAFASSDREQLSDTFLLQVMMLTGFYGNPLYAALHESIYGQGANATNWAAQRVRDGLRGFDSHIRPLPVTGEMIYPWMFDEICSLRAFAPAARAIAAYGQYRPLYDVERLACNEVPVVAAVYANDMYVPRALSLQTAQQVGHLKTWVTDEFEHDGVRQSPEVFIHLQQMLADKNE